MGKTYKDQQTNKGDYVSKGRIKTLHDKPVHKGNKPTARQLIDKGGEEADV